jgi:hypothetical protein
MAQRMLRSKRKPFREDLVVLSATVLMLFFLYVSVDYPSAMEQVEELSNIGSGGNLPPSGGGTKLIEENLLDETGYTNEGQSTDIPAEVPWSSVRWVNFTLTWADDIGSNDEFELKVLSDNEVLDSISGTSGELKLNIEGPPIGNYTVTITCIDAPGLVGPLPVDRDSGNDWSMTATVVREVEA